MIGCRALRGMAVAVALLVGGTMVHTDALAQAAKAKSASAGETVAPAEVYGKLLKNGSKEIIDAAEAMPADKYDFVPTAGKFDGVRSFGSQVQHLAEANFFFFSGFGVGPMPDEAKMKSLKSKDELVQALKDSFAYADKAIATMTPQNAFQTVPFGKQTITRAGAATFAMAHANDHYGQMVEYLRMNGIVPPASMKK